MDDEFTEEIIGVIKNEMLLRQAGRWEEADKQHGLALRALWNWRKLNGTGGILTEMAQEGRDLRKQIGWIEKYTRRIVALERG